MGKKFTRDNRVFSGFWNFIAVSFWSDLELVIYLAFYTAAMLLPLLVAKQIFSDANGVVNITFKEGGLYFAIASVWIYATSLTSLFSFAISYTEVQRCRGVNPTFVSVVIYVARKFLFIAKLAFLRCIFDFLIIIGSQIIDRLLSFLGLSFTRWIFDLIFGTAQLAESIFLGFLIPVAVSTDEENLSKLSKETIKILSKCLGGTVRVNAQVVLVSVLWAVISFLSLGFIPQYAPALLKPALLVIFGSIYPFFWFVQLCTTLIYTRSVVLINEQKLSGSKLDEALIQMGMTAVE